MIEFLLDTNILIYLVNRDPYYIEYFANNLKDRQIGISVISYIETLVGVDKLHVDAVSNYLTLRFSVVELDTMISYITTSSILERKVKGFRSPFLADAIIASTAIQLDIPLITNNPKDFKVFNNLKLVVP